MNEQVFQAIFSEIEDLKRGIRAPQENLAYQHVGDGAPSHEAAEGVFYWDYTNDDLYVNSDGGTTWQLIGGVTTSAQLLTSDSTTNLVAERGSLITAQGSSPTTWATLDHPGGIHYYLRSNSADPGWVTDITVAAGAYVGRTDDVRIEFNSGAGLLDLTLGDSAGSDQVRVVDSGGSGVVTFDSGGDAYFKGHGAFGGGSPDDAVLRLDQDDVDREFVRFVGEASSGTLNRNVVDYGDESSSTGAVWLKMAVEDGGGQVPTDYYYLLGYTLA